MQEIGEQLDSAIIAYAILFQLMHCSIASCVLHIAYCMLRWCKISLSTTHHPAYDILQSCPHLIEQHATNTLSTFERSHDTRCLASLLKRLSY